MLSCPSSHDKREVYPDFNVAWSEDLGFKQPIWGKARGLFNRTVHCPQCGSALEPPASGTREVTVCDKTQFAFRVAITGPWSRCPVCTTLYLRPRQDIFEAAVDALEQAGIERY